MNAPGSEPVISVKRAALSALYPDGSNADDSVVRLSWIRDSRRGREPGGLWSTRRLDTPSRESPASAGEMELTGGVTVAFISNSDCGRHDTGGFIPSTSVVSARFRAHSK